MKNLLLLGAAVAVLAACEDQPTDVYKPSTTWYYDCGNNLGLDWTFAEGERGEYYLNSGSRLTPVEGDATGNLYVRQDGTQFMVTGSADSWTLKNLSTGNETVCRRAIDPVGSGPVIIEN